MRFDYIQRFWNDFSEEGFKKLINQGHFFRNTRFGYVPTYTGPGHASQFLLEQPHQCMELLQIIGMIKTLKN